MAGAANPAATTNPYQAAAGAQQAAMGTTAGLMGATAAQGMANYQNPY